MNQLSKQDIIHSLHLKPLQNEGGYYLRTYQRFAQDEATDKTCLTPKVRPLSTAIYYLLTNEADGFSALHRLDADEIYHFYIGSPVSLNLFFDDGRYEEHVLGPDITHQQHLQFVVPAGVWQGSHILNEGEFALLGTTMAPGYSEDYFELADPDVLLRRYPDHDEIIRKLTRRRETNAPAITA